MAVVEVKDLTIRYHKTLAVNGISFTVEPGEVVGLLGGNGAGKSSTLKVLGGVLNHTSGDISIDGVKIVDYATADAARDVVGYCPDVGGLIPQATLREHIGLSLSLHNRLELWPQALELVKMFDLEHALDLPSAGYSHGMSRRTSVILATLASSSLLILDEPFDGVDPLGVASVKETIKMAKDAGVAVLVSTHLQDILTESTDRLLIMAKGSILATAPSEDYRGAEGVERYQETLRKAGSK